ncbi:MAG: ATP-binding protein [Candidatus Riflebacteria bacterium]|nr:ATP-binding protein [Candidatus Riflebacteria bacterium]
MTEKNRTDSVSGGSDAETSPPDMSPASTSVSLISSRKFESIGRLASGITHEINTPMHYLDNNIGFLKTSFVSLISLQKRYRELIGRINTMAPITPAELDDLAQFEKSIDPVYLETEIISALDQSLEGVDSVSKIVLALKDFSHPAQNEFSLADINRSIEGVAVITRHEWKRVADLRLALDQNLPFVHCSRDAVNQVLLNMIVNAAHAIKEKIDVGGYDHGSILIETLCAGDFITIRIIDDGPGISPENRNKVFQPFFTTKPAGKGTGQGLNLAWDIIVNRHRGSIEFETVPGKGTSFLIRLPVQPPSPSTPPSGVLSA